MSRLNNEQIESMSEGDIFFTKAHRSPIGEWVFKAFRNIKGCRYVLATRANSSHPVKIPAKIDLDYYAFFTTRQEAVDHNPHLFT